MKKKKKVKKEDNDLSATIFLRYPEVWKDGKVPEEIKEIYKEPRYYEFE